MAKTAYLTLSEAACGYAALVGDHSRPGGWIYTKDGARLCHGWAAYTERIRAEGLLVRKGRRWHVSERAAANLAAALSPFLKEEEAGPLDPDFEAAGIASWLGADPDPGAPADPDPGPGAPADPDALSLAPDDLVPIIVELHADLPRPESGKRAEIISRVVQVALPLLRAAAPSLHHARALTIAPVVTAVVAPAHLQALWALPCVATVHLSPVQFDGDELAVLRELAVLMETMPLLEQGRLQQETLAQDLPPMYGGTREEVQALRQVACHQFLDAVAHHARGRSQAAQHALIETRGTLARAAYVAEMCAREEERAEADPAQAAVHAVPAVTLRPALPPPRVQLLPALAQEETQEKDDPPPDDRRAPEQLLHTEEGLKVHLGGTQAPAPLCLYGAWREPGDGALWACGDQGAILRGGTGGFVLVRAASSAGERVLALSGTGPRDIWACGTQGLILHFDGIRWSEVSSQARPVLPGLGAVTLSSVFADPATRHVYFAGSHGGIVHHDGFRGLWEAQGPAERRRPLYGIHGSPEGDVWAVGAGGTTLLLGDGGRWTALVPATTADLHAVYVAPCGDVALAVGAGGTVLAWDGRSRWLHEPSSAKQTLCAVSHQAGRSVAVGSGEEAVARVSGAPWHPALLRRLDGAPCSLDEDLIFVQGNLALGHRGGLFQLLPGPVPAQRPSSLFSPSALGAGGAL